MILKAVIHGLSFSLGLYLLTYFFNSRCFEFKKYIKHKWIRTIITILIIFINSNISIGIREVENLILLSVWSIINGMILAIILRFAFGDRLNIKRILKENS